METGEDYKRFLDAAEAERLCVNEIVRHAREHGFLPLEEKTALLPGDCVYSVNRGKGAVLAVIASEPI